MPPGFEICVRRVFFFIAKLFLLHPALCCACCANVTMRTCRPCEDYLQARQSVWCSGSCDQAAWIFIFTATLKAHGLPMSSAYYQHLSTGPCNRHSRGGSWEKAPVSTSARCILPWVPILNAESSPSQLDPASPPSSARGEYRQGCTTRSHTQKGGPRADRGTPEQAGLQARQARPSAHQFYQWAGDGAREAGESEVKVVSFTSVTGLPFSQVSGSPPQLHAANSLTSPNRT